MEPKNIISFNGDHGSGKSTIAKMLAKELGFKRFYMGKIFRKMADEQGFSYSEFLDVLKDDLSYDKKVDDYVLQLAREKNNFIIESRTAWCFIPKSFKIYLKVDEKEGAKRMFLDYQTSINNRNNESKNIKTLEDIVKISRRRKKEDDKRYKKFYNINPNDMKHYDLVVDTTKLAKQEVLNKVKEAVNTFLKNNEK